MTIDELAALLQAAPVFAPGSLVVVRAPRELDPYSLRQLSEYCGQLRERVGIEFMLVNDGADAIGVELAGQIATAAQVTVALLEARRQPSVQDQAAALAKQFLVIRRPEAHG